jgi:hypothetical protein
MKILFVSADFYKSHVAAYTKKDGTFVAAHEDKRVARHDNEPAGHVWGGDTVVNQIKEAIEDDPHADWGLRVIPHDHPVNEGDELPPSYRWDDGEQTDEELDGTSTIGIRANGSVERAIKVLNQGGYVGAQVALVRGDSRGAGEDPGEVLLSDAEVVLVWGCPAPMTKSATPPIRLFLKSRPSV